MVSMWHWQLPNGNAATDDLEFDPIHMANRSGQVGLPYKGVLNDPPYQGMYTFTIPSENGVTQTLVVWTNTCRSSDYDGKIEIVSLIIICMTLGLSVWFIIQWMRYDYISFTVVVKSANVCTSFEFGKMWCVVTQLHVLTADDLSELEYETNNKRTRSADNIHNKCNSAQ